MTPRTLFAFIFAFSTLAGAAPTSQPTTKPVSRPTTEPSLLNPTQQQTRAKLQDLMRRSLELFKQKKYAQLDAVITEALTIDPYNATNIYNMACLKSITNKLDDSMAYLERAADAGFTDFIHIEQDHDLDNVRAHPRYKNFIASKDFYQKKDADRELAVLKKEFGDKYIYEIDPSTKLIFAADTDIETLNSVKKWLTAQAKSQWAQLFDHKPDQYVSIVLPSLADYKKIIRQPGVEGIYMHQAHMLIARRLGQVMTHEFTHALNAGDLDSVGQEHPIWIVEGLASLFEAGQFEGEKLVPRDNYRLWFLQQAYRTKRLIPLEKLFGWKQPQFVSNANLGYGESSSVMLYLYETGLLKKFYDTYKINFEKDPTGKLTIEQVSNKKLTDFEQDWQAWMMKRTPPATNTGPEGAFIGVQFAQENDGLKIEQVVIKSPAEYAGVKAGDIVVGLNDLDIRDQQSLMPILKEFKPGEHVTFKLRRGEEYLSVPLTLGRRDGKTPVPATAPAGKK